ncbi:Transglutaminase-like enzyme, putative cysteine protease [Amphibacillus marinus]|uniref:Transglutaminase-like enzyme, putative cysteine protease n=1 Tax=Amphibacillus marinus TaxID=872970 RepID=A0A1H8L8Q5_9BACI|nr:transglutaminase family protein [Amphibacillus marinus]SEO01108.1 Transglutaminase-like enzyme, putative cysteine protease [Amphibacillus marinus]
MKKQTTLGKGQSVLTACLYFGGLLLALEWIKPLQELADTDYFRLFTIFAVFCFTLTYLQLPAVLSIIIKSGAIIVIVNWLFLPGTMLSQQWTSYLINEWQLNSRAIGRLNWYGLTDMFEVLLFLLLITLLSYLLYFWLITMKRAFIYILLTFTFVTVLDTFTNYQANYAIIRLFAISLVMLALTSYLKRLQQYQLKVNLTKWLNKLVTPLAMLLIASLLLGFLLPKREPVWPDPVPLLTELTGLFANGVGGLSQVGYSEDDSTLGGSFAQNNTPLFRTETQSNHYWRIESKDFYTGSGWERTTDLNFQPFEADALEINFNDNTQPMQEATVEYLDAVNFDYLVYPYGLSQPAPTENGGFIFDQESGFVQSEQGSLPRNEPISLFYQYPDFSTDQLRNSVGGYPAAATRYLQLPDSLPERVYQLAAELTEGEETIYDQVVAIEQYFDQGEFTYQTRNVPIPRDDQDYVDQFLFETQYGYCDNFSTAMVVMLRTLGIPARWVKGFTGGELLENLSTEDETLYRYEVRNSNAHSWVEVYFPEQGWVSFEPTIGFSGEEMVYQETGDTENEQDPLNEEEIEETEQPEQDEEQEEQEDETQGENESELEATAEEADEAPSVTVTIWPWLLGLVILAIVVAGIRWKWCIKQLFFWRWARFSTAEELQHAYHMLLKLLALRGLKRSADQTLQQFAQIVDQKLATNELSQLTSYYSRILYRNEAELVEPEKIQQLYRSILETILA